MDPELRRLREERQGAPTLTVRAKLSKLILKVTRQKLREYRTKQIQERLTEFADFQHIEHAHMYPVKKKSVVKPDENKCAELLKEVYSTSTPFEYAPTCNVPVFTKVELSNALRIMRKKKVLIKVVFFAKCSSMRMKKCYNAYLVFSMIL